MSNKHKMIKPLAVIVNHQGERACWSSGLQEAPRETAIEYSSVHQHRDVHRNGCSKIWVDAVFATQHTGEASTLGEIDAAQLRLCVRNLASIQYCVRARMHDGSYMITQAWL